MSDEKKLTKKQQLFILEYLKDFNATRAAKDAGYSPHTAYSIGYELLRKPEIIAIIDEEMQRRIMGANEVLTRLTDMGRGDIGELMSVSSMGFSLDMQAAKEAGLTKLIKRVKQKTTTFIARKPTDEDREVHEIEIELYDAQAALEKLGRYHKLFNDNPPQLEVNLKVDGLTDLLKNVYGNREFIQQYEHKPGTD